MLHYFIRYLNNTKLKKNNHYIIEIRKVNKCKIKVKKTLHNYKILTFKASHSDISQFYLELFVP